ncbi:MAG TPA: HEAT repeat domain-containing protein [Thermodesulfobacteriota bacterium]|nr:HEAT repeat domain-containing protein [Thermodesulfobacteriota bacterium]
MAEIAAEQKENIEQQEVPKEEVSSAAEVMQTMVKTSKAFKMYLSNNPLLHRFLEELKTKMGSHLAKYSELKLDIDQFELRYKGKTVYENRDPKDSLAFKIYSDGIRSLIFSEGMEDKEISDFLEIVGKDRPSDIDDDIVTLLWMKDLPHVTYILAEDYLEFDTSHAGPTAPTSQQENIKGLYKAIPTLSEVVPTPMLIPQNILSLNEDEISWLKKAKELDEKRNPLDEVVQILFSILSVEKDFSVFGDFVDITANLIGNLIHSGDIHYAVHLIRFLRELSKNETLSSSHKDRLAKAMEVTVSEDIVKDLQEIIDTSDKIKPESLKELLLLFDKTAIKQICELLGIVQKMEMRKVIVDTLVEIGKDSSEVFYPFLTDNRWYLVRNAVIILRRIDNPVSLEPVSKLICHKEPRIRKEVLLYLAAVPDVKAKAYILKFLHDEISALRMHALKVLADSKFHGALKPVFEITASKEFDDKDISEKKAVFEALGELGSDEVVPIFKDMLMKRYWFNKAKEKESVVLAVAGLRKIKTDAALNALEEASNVKKDEIKAVITQALRFISAEKAKVLTK